MPTYTYSLSVDFGGSISIPQLESEITNEAGITKILKDIKLGDDDVDIEFDDNLTAGEQTTLNGIVSAHNTNLTSASVVGKHYIYAESSAESSTTSTNYVQKMSLTTQYYPIATHVKVEWYYRKAGDEDNKDMQFRVQLDDTTTLHEEIVWLFNNNFEGKQYSCGFWVGQVGIGTHTIDVDFLTTDSGKTVIISDVRLMVTDL